MSELEDLLTRTLRDPDRALRAPADPLPGIRARARAQRRTAALAAAAVVAVLAAGLLVPAVLRGRAPAPVPTAAPPASSGLLPWAARGPLVTDTGLLRDAVRVWQEAGGPADARVLWAGPLDGDRTVLLQGGHGPGAIAQVGERAGRLTVVRAEPLHDPDIELVQLVGPGRTLLLAEPAAATVRLLESPGGSVPAGGLVDLGRDLTGQSVALLDRDGRVVGDGTVPPPGQLVTFRGDVRLVRPVWEVAGGPPSPSSLDLAAGQVLGERLRESPMRIPVWVGALSGGSTATLPGGRKASPVSYELHQAGRTYLGSIVWVDGQPLCPQLAEVTDRPQADALVVRCPVPATGVGVLSVELHEGIRLARLRLAAAGPGQRAADRTFRAPLGGGLVTVLEAGFPTGPGELGLVDDARQARPPLRIPAYRP